MTVATDEIYEKYLQKAITEINALGDEIAHAGAGSRVPVVGSGHPLADVFLLKHSPQPSELQEGVAFYGRAGNALLKSLQRLHVDPMAIYGTNCLKFADGDEDESRPFLLRELHIVQPKLVVVMGAPAREYLNATRFPLARELAPAEGELQEFTPMIQGLVTPDIDESLDEQPAKTAFWNAFKMLGEKPMPITGRLQEVFLEDFRKELAEMQSPEAKRLFILAKLIHLFHLRVGEYVALIAAADMTGNFGVGVLLESCLADKLAFAERTRRLLRKVAETRIAERAA